MTTTVPCAGSTVVACPACGERAWTRWYRTVTGRLVPGRATYGCDCPEARYAVAAAAGEDAATGRVVAGQLGLPL